MEVEGAQEGSSATVRLQLTGADLQIDGGDPEGRQLAVTLYLHATALVRREEELTLLRDLYSTAYELTYDASPMSLVTYWESTHRRQNVRESLEIGVVAEDILSVQADCGAVAVSPGGRRNGSAHRCIRAGTVSG